MAIESPSYVISADSHSAALFRQTAQTMLTSTGVVGAGDLAVGQNGTPNMSVNVAAGMVWCPGTLGATAGMASNLLPQTAYGLPSSFTSQGSYCSYNDAAANLTISAADPTNPRIDIVCASIQDAQYSGSNNQPVLQVITGTPAPSPAAPAAPASTVVLAQVAVAAGATSIVTGNITDERTFASSLPTRVPIFSGYQSTAQSIPNAAYTPINIDTTAIDTHSGHSNATNNSRYTTQVAGWYRVGGGAAFSANTTGTRAVVLSVNGSHGSAFNYTQVQTSAATTSTQILQTSWLLGLSVGDYVEVCAYQNSGAALSLAAFYSGMAIQWVRP